MGSKKKKEEIDVNKLIALEQELHELKAEQGIEEKEGWISRKISGYFDRKEAMGEIALDKKKYVLLAVFTGWLGGHRFYAKQYKTAILYFLLFWSGFPLAMTLIDLLIVIPKPVDEQGKMCL